MANIRILLLITLCVIVADAHSQTAPNTPQVGYVYPGGGQRGTTFTINVGGQNLRGVKDVYVSGDGIKATVIKYVKPPRNINGDQRKAIENGIQEVYEKRMEEIHGAGYARAMARKEAEKNKKSGKAKIPVKKTDEKKEQEKEPEVKMPPHPLLHDLESKSLRELEHIKSIVFMSRNKLQLNRQIGECVLVEVTVDPDAKPGNRELRIAASTGLSNPVVFQVGQSPEVSELEPNDRQAYIDKPRKDSLSLPKPDPIDTPVVFNGQVMPGDIDRFRFRAKKGQHLVIETHARSLIPYLADAVPGWFQATIQLYDSTGKELAFADDYRFNPDPVMFFEVPEDGEYELAIRDSIYRGREDFVYRIAVGEQPFITEVFPLGAKPNSRTVAEIDGWNLDKKQLAFDTKTDEDGICSVAYDDGELISNPVTYAIDSLPQCAEEEANDSTTGAQQITLPMIVNGRIDKPGDVDVFRFSGPSGGKIVAEVFARRLNSPVDSIIKLTDSTGKVIEWNDDYVITDSFLHKDITGTTTHHADSYLTADLPKPGTYCIRMADTQRHGGKPYAYRLRISEPQPDFDLFVTPSSLNVTSGGILPIGVHVLRKDGFDGEIELSLKDAPEGFDITASVPPGKDYVITTLLTSPKQPTGMIPLNIQGTAKIGAKTITRTAHPADDKMQAFLYRHLLPAQELVIACKKEKWAPARLQLLTAGPVKITEGSSAKIIYKTSNKSIINEMKLVLKDPPQGVTLHGVTAVPQGLSFQLKADKGTIEDTAFHDNIIVEAFREYRSKDKKGNPTGTKKSYSMGVLPAIPVEIVQ